VRREQIKFPRIKKERGREKGRRGGERKGEVGETDSCLS
jgi:hypothetical protein